ncbi:zinc finger protein 586-like isoform X2 [Ambystoma mexicanum]|uniref:zinc finger protein 586-like isoform X2 n=1 Tax=Ambystoma mexicanum TaxID=8296 RepID=UPI0037E93AC5
MARQDSHKLPVSFCDVVASFSEEEWKLLHTWQEELYKNVMKEIHQALFSLGCQSNNKKNCLRMEEESAAVLMDCRGAEVDGRNTRSSSVISFTIKEEDSACAMDDHHSEQINKICRHEDDPIVKPAISISMPPKEEIQSQVEPVHQEIASGDGSSNKEREMRYRTARPDKTPKYKGFPVKVKGKGTHSRRPLWLGNNPDLEGNKTAQCESGFSNPVYSNVQHDISQNEPHGNYNTFEGIVQERCQPHVYYEGEKTFAVTQLQRQESTHPIERVYNSNEGERSFGWAGSAIEQKTAHVGDKQYQCTECEKSFKHKESLIEHLRTHTGQRPYQCTDCGKSFIRKRTLIAHRRIHTGERPYQCTGCGKSFSLKHNLNTHQKTCRHFL